MKKLNKYIMLFVAAFALVGCVDDVIDTPSTEIMAGEEVQFGLSLPTSRTIYGPEYDETVDGIRVHNFPIYWSEGDMVQIFSPDCPASRNNAEYKVKPVAGQSYAESLTKTGATGIQWGSTDAKFYSVYPSADASFTESNGTVTATLNISSEQRGAAVEGEVAADMNNVIMYAETDKIKNGTTVNLNYKPYSTILQFILSIKENVDEQGNKLGFGTVSVFSISLEAFDEDGEGIDITGDFDLEFNGDAPTISTVGNNGNKITVTTENMMLSEENQTAMVNMALIPRDDVESIAGWKVSVTIREGASSETTTKTMTLTPAEGKNTALAPGKIHQITLPSFSSTEKWIPDLSNWLPTLYDYQNIYLTQLSIPGAWCTGSKIDRYESNWLGQQEFKKGDGYQSTQSISDLWNAGVRAFAIECKSTTSGWTSGTYANVAVSGTASGTLSGGNQYDGKKISTVINEINTVLDNNEDEFAVLVLSYADGGEDAQNTGSHNYFLKGLQAEIDASSIDERLYGYNDGEILTCNTTVKDVLGRLVVLVYVDWEIKKSSYADNLTALFTYVPHLNQFTSGMETPFEGYLSTLMYSKMHWKSWTDTNKSFVTTAPGATTDNSIYLCFSSANRTQKNDGTNTTLPTYSARKSMLRSMISHSREVTLGEEYTNNIWFAFNAGGAEATSLTSAADGLPLAAEMNSWLLDVINIKKNGGTDTYGNYTGTAGTVVKPDASPLGLVFYNQCVGNDYNGEDIAKAIIEMNNAFELKRYVQEPGDGPIM